MAANAERPDPAQLLLQLVQVMQSPSANTNTSATTSSTDTVAREHRLMFRGRNRRSRDDGRSNDDGKFMFSFVLALSLLHVSLLPHGCLQQ